MPQSQMSISQTGRNPLNWKVGKTGYAYYPASQSMWGPNTSNSGYFRGSPFTFNFSPASMPKKVQAQDLSRLMGTNIPYQNSRGMWVTGAGGALHTGAVVRNGQVMGYSHKGYTGATPEEARKNWQRSQLSGEDGRYTGREVVRNPALAAEVAGAYDTYGDVSRQTQDQFNKWLSEFQSQLPNMRESLDQSMQAYDLTGLESELRGLEGQRRSDFEDINSRYTAADEAWNNNALNAIRRGEQLAYNYEHNLAPKLRDFATNRAYNEVARRFAPLGGRANSDLDAALSSEAYKAALDIANRSYANNMDVLRNIRMPLESQMRANEAARLTGFEYPGRNNLINSQEQMLWNLQNMRTQLAGRPIQDVEAYLKAVGLPAQYAQELMSGDLRNLAAIAGLDESSYYRGLEDRRGMDIAQPAQVYAGGYPSLAPAESSMPPLSYEDMYSYPTAGNAAAARGPYGEPMLTDIYGNTMSPTGFNARADVQAALGAVAGRQPTPAYADRGARYGGGFGVTGNSGVIWDEAQRRYVPMEQYYQ